MKDFKDFIATDSETLTQMLELKRVVEDYASNFPMPGIDSP